MRVDRETRGAELVVEAEHLGYEGETFVRVAVTGAGPVVFRVKDFEARLSQDFRAEALQGTTVPARGLTSDVHGTPEYRAHLIGELTRRAVAQCRAAA